MVRIFSVENLCENVTTIMGQEKGKKSIYYIIVHVVYDIYIKKNVTTIMG